MNHTQALPTRGQHSERGSKKTSYPEAMLEMHGMAQVEMLMWLRKRCQEWTSEEHIRGTVVISQVGGKMSVSKDTGA